MTTLTPYTGYCLFHRLAGMEDSRTARFELFETLAARCLAMMWRARVREVGR